ncbi:hypothetical protein ACL2XO_16570 [Sodalis sp. RH15]|uniref:hypothetical protein n=1 Tax=Sodalis sp. RH15 TaxID=3394330 RepID=UPI0039B6C954
MPGNPLLDINNLSDVSDAATARDNLDVYSQAESDEQLTNQVGLPVGTVSQAISYVTPSMFDSIQDADSYAMEHGLELVFTAGTYTLTGYTNTSDLPVRWRAQGEVIINVQGSPLGFNSTRKQVTLNGSSLRDQNVVTILDSSIVSVGAILLLKADERVETRRSDEYIKRSIKRVKSIATGSVILDSNLFFDHSATDTSVSAYVYNTPRKVYLKGIHFHATTGVQYALAFTGIADCEGLINCKFSSDDNATIDAFHCQESYNISAYNIELVNVRYGCKNITTANCRTDKIRGNNCRHLTYSADWAENTIYNDIIGRDNIASVDSHNALFTTISNVFSEGDSEISNNRSYGGTIENWKIQVSTFPTGTEELGLLTLSNQVWTNGTNGVDYRNRWKKIGDVKIKNIIIESSDGSLPSNGIALLVTGGRFLQADNLFIGDIDISQGAQIGDQGDNFKYVVLNKTNINFNQSYTSSLTKTLIRIDNEILPDGKINASFSNGIFSIYLPYDGKYGVLNRSAQRTEGEIPLKDYLTFANPMSITLNVFDHPNPFGHGSGQKGIVIAHLKILVIQSITSAIRFDMLSTELAWKHNFATDTASNKLNITSLYNFQGPSSQAGDGLSITLTSTPTVIDPIRDGTGVFSDFGVNIPLTISNTNPSYIGDFRIFYELELFEMDQ